MHGENVRERVSPPAPPAAGSLLIGPEAVLVAVLVRDDVLGIGREERLGLVPGLEVLPHIDAVGLDSDEHDVVVLFHGVGGGFADLDEDPSVLPDDVGDVLVLIGIGRLGGELRGRLPAADGRAVAFARVRLLEDLSAFLAFVVLDCRGCYLRAQNLLRRF